MFDPSQFKNIGYRRHMETLHKNSFAVFYGCLNRWLVDDTQLFREMRARKGTRRSYCC